MVTASMATKIVSREILLNKVTDDEDVMEGRHHRWSQEEEDET